MKKPWGMIAFVILFLALTVAESQAKRPRFKRALLFEWTEGLRLSPFREGLGMKFRLGKDWALVTSLKGRYNRNENHPTDYRDRSSSVGMSMGLDRYVLKQRNLWMYTGLHLSGQWDFVRRKGAKDWEENRSIWNVTLALGGEYFFLKRFSLAAQYEVRYTRESNSNRSIGSDSWTLSLGAARLVLAIYF